MGKKKEDKKKTKLCPSFLNAKSERGSKFRDKILSHLRLFSFIFFLSSSLLHSFPRFLPPLPLNAIASFYSCNEPHLPPIPYLIHLFFLSPFHSSLPSHPFPPFYPFLYTLLISSSRILSTFCSPFSSLFSFVCLISPFPFSL